MTSGNFLRRRTPEPKSAAGIRRRDLHAEDGNALLAVIGVVGVLAALGVAYQATVAAQSRTYDALAAGISNQNAADAAVSLGLWRVADQWRENGAALHGAAWRCRHGGVEVVIVIEDEAFRLNLNLAAPAAIANELARLGVAPGLAAVTAGRIADFVDRDSAGFDGRPEAATFEVVGGTAPRNQPVEIIEELRLVPGVDAAMFDLLRRKFSLFSTRTDRLSGVQGGASAPGAEARGVFRITAFSIGQDGAAQGSARTAVAEFYPADAYRPVVRQWSVTPLQDDAATAPRNANAACVDALRGG
ncbi:MAG TPA: hypothetical protein DEA50_11660 [Parvularcula sp.]|nr:hypothetical protein [Parvularcula sp.]